MVVLPGLGWNRIRGLCGESCRTADSMWLIIIAWVAGATGLLGLLFAIGYTITCNWKMAGILLATAIVATVTYFKLFNKLSHFNDVD